MSTKTIQTRIKNRFDTLAEWSKSGVTLLPGEIALVSVTTQQIDENTGNVVDVPAVLMKVGAVYTAVEAAEKGDASLEGKNKPFSELPWVSALAADVYDWAKTPESCDIDVKVITGSDDDGSTYTTKKLGIWLKEYEVGISTNAANISANTEAIRKLNSDDAEDGSVANKIKIAIDALDTTDAQATTDTTTTTKSNFVTVVTQNDGKIAVTKKAIAAIDLPDISASKIKVNTNTTLTSKLGIMDAAIASLRETVAGGVHFRGIATSEPKAATVTLVGGKTLTAAVGDVVIFDGKEFIYAEYTIEVPIEGDVPEYITEYAWEQLGDITRLGELERYVTNLDANSTEYGAGAHKFAIAVDQLAGLVTVNYARPTATDVLYTTDRTVNDKFEELDALIASKSDSGHTHEDYVNQNAFTHIKTSNGTVSADNTTDTVEFTGTNITITGTDDTNDVINFSVDEATAGSDGTAGTKGVVALVDSVSSESKTAAATADAVRTAYNKGADGLAAAVAIAANYIKITDDNLVSQAGDIIIFDCGGAADL